MAIGIRKGTLLWGLVLAIALGGATGVQGRLAAQPRPEIDVNMLFVPPHDLTLGMVTGFQNLAADGLWLGLIQYYGDRVIKLHTPFSNLAPMFALITDLDPHFYFAYWLGSWALADAKESPAAVRLMEKGERFNPREYLYPYQLGFVAFLGAKDYPLASQAFLRASTLPGAPRFARTMAARMLQSQGLDAEALGIWTRLYNTSTDQVVRGIAKRNVDRIQAEMKGDVPRSFKLLPKPAR